MTVVYILNELCADKQHYNVIGAPEHIGFIQWCVEGRHGSHQGACDELMKVQSDWREGLRYWVQSRISNFNEALDEVKSLLQRKAWYSDRRV